MSNHRKSQREKDLTGRYLSGNLDEDRMKSDQRLSGRADRDQAKKTIKTALMRAAEEAESVDPETLPIGQVMQVFSRFSEVEHNGATYLCVVRKTLNKISDTSIVVGDLVRYRDLALKDDTGRPEGVIEAIEPRRTILTRADSFKAIEQHPIVANAEQMLIVASLKLPDVKWGLIDRMIVAAKAGGLVPIVCLNKVDLKGDSGEALQSAQQALAHYTSLGITTLQTSVESRDGLDDVRDVLRNRTTVLSGHSGVGKSSLIRAIQPSLDLRIGAISGYTGKGRHTTTTARRYPLDIGGAVIDTPGVKLFGLWNVSRDNLLEFFPDVEAETAPDWRKESYQRIVESLPG